MSAEDAHDGTPDEINRIKSRIEYLLEENFNRGEPVYYLSKLGAQLGVDRAILERLTGIKLASFLRESLDYEIGSEGQHNNILFVKSKVAARISAPSPAHIPRYQSSFWAAFATPLSEGTKRYINLDTIKFASSREEVEGNETNVREIEARFIAPSDASGSASQIGERICDWLNEQQLDATPFLATRKKFRRDDRSLLETILTALDAEQLKRISLPLDIVKTLNDYSH